MRCFVLIVEIDICFLKPFSLDCIQSTVFPTTNCIRVWSILLSRDDSSTNTLDASNLQDPLSAIAIHYLPTCQVLLCVIFSLQCFHLGLIQHQLF